MRLLRGVTEESDGGGTSGLYTSLRYGLNGTRNRLAAVHATITESRKRWIANNIPPLYGSRNPSSVQVHGGQNLSQIPSIPE